tara:strand:+ start:104 stop:304 length:201 start_codon:yes stop_codon:yes gene_type:complete
MAIINCPECNNNVSDKAEKCPKCAYPIKKAESNEGCFLQTLNVGCVMTFSVIAIILIFILIMSLFS